jgi:serine/threonine protein kinase
MYKNKYTKYSSKLKNMMDLKGGLVCHPNINTNIIENIKSAYKFEGNYHTGFRKIQNGKNYLIKPYITSLGEKKMVGEGATGKVYLGRLLFTHDQYSQSISIVIKELNSNDDKNKHFICNELATVIHINHPNIVKYFGYAEINTPDQPENNIVCIFMEYINGKDLYDCMVDNLLTEKNKINIAKQLIDGLVYLHKNKIYHRDIKLENIMVENIGKENIRIKYLDFGFGCKQFVSCESTIYSQGTVNYISPDFAKNIINKNHDRNLYEYCDLWALGTLLYSFFSKQLLFVFENSPKSLNKITKITQNEIDEKINNYIKPLNLPQQITENIISLLQTDPKQRHIIPTDDLYFPLSSTPLNQNLKPEQKQESNTNLKQDLKQESNPNLKQESNTN